MSRLPLMSRLAVGAIAAVVALACGSQTSTNNQTTENQPGVTKDQITIGATFPASGPASAYYSVAKGADAYFEYVNAHGGVAGGRKIKYIVLDDQYSSNITPAKARELVEQDNVFLTFGDLGTPNNLAVRDYYNQQKVPQLQVFTGSDHWGNDYDQYKWTIGWQPDYGAESIVYSKWIKQNASDAKIAILYQNDDYGLDYVKGLKQGLGSDYDKMVVKTATYATNDPVDMSSQVNQLKASGANWFYVVATPNYAKSAVEKAVQSGWNPKFIMNNVAASASTWRAAVKDLGTSAPVDGMLSTAYLKDPLDTTRYSSDKGVQLFKDVMTQYGGALASPACPADGSDAFCVSGMASAYTLIWALNKAQKDGQLTRQHVMDVECCNLKVTDDPLLLPGMVVYTSKSDHFPIRQMQIETWQADHWVLQGNLIDGRPGGTPK
jgi:ABC-type branched-subunit amino acid transport system substrate-binding protein